MAHVAAGDRAWCDALAARCTMQRIPRAGVPYLDRYFVAGWSPRDRRHGPAVFLHHFVDSDSRDEMHSHPWAAISLLLVGAYREHRCAPDGSATVRDLQAGDTNVLAPTDRHRIELLTPDVWTLILVSDVVQPWGFVPSC